MLKKKSPWSLEAFRPPIYQDWLEEHESHYMVRQELHANVHTDVRREVSMVGADAS